MSRPSRFISMITWHNPKEWRRKYVVHIIDRHRTTPPKNLLYGMTLHKRVNVRVIPCKSSKVCLERIPAKSIHF